MLCKVVSCMWWEASAREGSHELCQLRCWRFWCAEPWILCASDLGMAMHSKAEPSLACKSVQKRQPTKSTTSKELAIDSCDRFKMALSIILYYRPRICLNAHHDMPVFILPCALSIANHCLILAHGLLQKIGKLFFVHCWTFCINCWTFNALSVVFGCGEVRKWPWGLELHPILNELL